MMRRSKGWLVGVVVLVLVLGSVLNPSLSSALEIDESSTLVISECSGTVQEELVYCDDFEANKMSQYYDYYSRWGRWNREFGKGLGESSSMVAYNGFYGGDQTGGVSTPPHGTWLKLAIGSTPDDTYYKPVGDPSTTERELYWRFYVKQHTESDGTDLSSTGLLAQVSAIGPGDIPFMRVDIQHPDQSGVLVSELYTGQFDSAGEPSGSVLHDVLTGDTPVMHLDGAGTWHEIQVRVKLNEPGASDGVYELWVDGELEAEKTGIDWVGDYTDYGINAIQLHNVNNQPGVLGGDLEYRAFDNMMLSRKPIASAGVISEDNASLRELTVDGGKLTPTFRSNTLDFVVEANHGVKKIKLYPVTADDEATIKVNGKKPKKHKPIEINMKKKKREIRIEVTARDGISKKLYTINSVYPDYRINECANPQPDWLFCDDFESDRSDQYFEHTNPDQFYRDAEVGLQGSSAMRAEFRAADGEQFDTGALKVAFGRTPHAYMDPVAAEGEDLREVYFRFYLKHEEGWTGGGGDKMARLTSMQNADWAQTAIAHVWSGINNSRDYLVAEAVSGTDAAGVLKSTGWNDFPNHRYMGGALSEMPIFHEDHVGKWYSIETHVKLNDPGQNNGVFEIWIDDVLEAARYDLNWIGSFEIGPEAGYGFNWFALENYWNAGTPQDQERYFDNLVISRSKIGTAVQP